MRKQIEALQKKRNMHVDAMAAASLLAETEDRLFTADEGKAFDKDQSEITDIDAQLERLIRAEEQMAKTARPAPHPLIPTNDVVVKAFKPFPGQAFTRYVSALAVSKGNLLQAVEIAKRWENETPEVLSVLRHAATIGNTNDPAQWFVRAPSVAGTTTNSTWAAPLVNYASMTGEFMELLRPETIFGRLNFVSVPFNVKIPRQTAGATAGWVGEGLSKPVSALSFDSVSFPFAKIAVIVVITQELARFSEPSAEALIRNDLINAIAEFIDKQMWDATVTPSAGVRPGALTNGAPTAVATGDTVAAVTADLAAAMMRVSGPPNNIPMRRPAWIMSPALAMWLGTLRTAQDVFAFPAMGIGGAPNLLGIPVIVSANLTPATTIVLVEQSEVYLADDGQTTVDTSAEASVQLDTAPATPPTPLVSFWQQNLLGIKAERFIYWDMRRDAAITTITSVGPTVPPP